MSFLDFLLPQNSDPSQRSSMNRMGLLNAAAQLANMSAPSMGFKATPIQLIKSGLLGYKQGADERLKQFYQDKIDQSKAAQADVDSAYNKQNLDWFNNQRSPEPLTPSYFYKSPLTQAMIKQESGGNPNAVSPKGAQGLMQIMPDTAKNPGMGVTPLQNSTPEENVRFGEDYMNALTKKYGGNKQLALMAYNWGTGNVDNWMKNGSDPNKVPDETKQYVSNIMDSVNQQPMEQITQQAMKNHLMQLAEMQMRAGKTGGDTLFRLAAAYDPMFKENGNETPAVIKIADEIAKARASGDKQRLDDLLALTKTSTAPATNVSFDNNLSGQAFLDTLDPQMAAVVKLIGDGKEKSSTILSRMKSDEKKIILAAVNKYNPDYSSNIVSADAKFEYGTLGNTIRSLNTSISHMNDVLSPAIDALNNGDYKAFNKAANFIAEQTGEPAPTNFNAVRDIVAQEIVKSIVANGGTGAERDEAKATILNTNSPRQLKGVIEQYTRLLRGQLKGLERQYKASTGRDDFDKKFLTPETKNSLNGGENQNNKARLIYNPETGDFE